MDGSTVRHWVETPVRYGDMFSAKKLEEQTLIHRLFALPGPPSAGKLRESGSAEKTEVETTEPADGETRANKALPGGHIHLDVVQFRPEDIMIQIFEGWLIVKAQHGRRMDEHGFISRRFTRMWRLPPGVLAKDVSAMLCHDGILTVELQKRA
ncbi:heat shock protein beta-3 [Ambystoma mexicanum]|uniref:heat shock protein beta-3 n=1 Tax=Ambystoma mexicanum TaxID=8296 RepID=UPI0037E720A7